MSTWVVAAAIIGGAVVGGAATAYGANKNAKAIEKSNATNAQSVADTNATNYKMWQESRGIGANGKPVNSQLPQWMSVRTGSGGPRRFGRAATITKQTDSLVASGSSDANSPTAKGVGVWDNMTDYDLGQATSEQRRAAQKKYSNSLIPNLLTGGLYSTSGSGGALNFKRDAAGIGGGG